MALYRDQGIVLRTYKLGEADRIVSFMTERHGKVRAVAKGVRKTKSKFGARLEPPTHVALQLYEGRELDIVTQAESIDHFRAIREDLDRLTRAVTMLEAVDQLSLEREPNPELYRMLLGGLKAIAERNSALLVAGFHWKLLALEGFRPVVEHCAACEREDGLVAFDPDVGGSSARTTARAPGCRPRPSPCSRTSSADGWPLHSSCPHPRGPTRSISSRRGSWSTTSSVACGPSACSSSRPGPHCWAGTQDWEVSSHWNQTPLAWS
ncbi:DNA repair protein RecO [Aquihabitans daechungensis]|uniref:DNA repair protein RecO n=1 Tax=Aquihabitans daechungensis TaxID=1052257 RepID=UPI003BA2D116